MTAALPVRRLSTKSTRFMNSRRLARPGERVVEGLALELDLQLAQLVDLVVRLVLAERRAGLVGERVEERDLGAREGARRARAGRRACIVPIHAAHAGQRREHRALDAERAAGGPASAPPTASRA